jgi:drug/metabolite transporter (DMT)-like permease
MFYILACTLFGISFFYVPMPIAFSISKFKLYQFIDNLSPLVVMLFDYLFYNTRISKQQIFAGLIGFVGITILTLNSKPS